MKLGFDGGIKIEFHGAKVTSDGGLLVYRDLDDALGLFDSVSANFKDNRTGRNIRHAMPTLLRQSIYSRLAGYEDVNDAGRLSVDPVMRAITGKNDNGKHAASANTMGRFETEIMTKQENLSSLSDINGLWVQRAMNKTLVASQPAREAYKDRSESCQARQICYISDGGGCNRQKVVRRDIVPDRTIALLFCVKHYITSRYESMERCL